MLGKGIKYYDNEFMNNMKIFTMKYCSSRDFNDGLWMVIWSLMFDNTTMEKYVDKTHTEGDHFLLEKIIILETWKLRLYFDLLIVIRRLWSCISADIMGFKWQRFIINLYFIWNSLML